MLQSGVLSMGNKQSGSRSQQQQHGYMPPSFPGSASSTHSYYSGTYSQSFNQSHSRYTRFDDDYSSLEQVTEALAGAGLESSNLIVGIDFTKSNEWTGARSYQRRSLHHLGDSLNPYEQAISIIGRTLSAFDEDNLIPCYGFGDATTHDQDVFSFFSDDKPCTGFEEALTRYREIVPRIRLAGPTSFTPIIETAIGIVNETGGQYHVLLIIADGQVTRSVDTNPGQLSSQERSTIAAIVEASKYPLSIILVGVGDGPWDMMMQFDDNIPSRAFDNFQFVNFTEIMSKNVPIFQKETEFALAALMEIPSQYKATLDFQLLSNQRTTTRRNALPPPIQNRSTTHSNRNYMQSNNVMQSDRMYYTPQPPSTQNILPNRGCPICSYNMKDLAFGCGHQTCYECGKDLFICPECHLPITTKIRLYG